MIYEPDGTNNHKYDDDNGGHVSGGTPVIPRGPITSDPLDRAEDWHGENHLNQGTDAHEGESEEELLDQSDDEAVRFSDEWDWAMLRSAVKTFASVNYTKLVVQYRQSRGDEIPEGVNRVKNNTKRCMNLRRLPARTGRDRKR